MRPFSSFQALKTASIRATGVAMVAGAFAGSVIIACTDSAEKSITAPTNSALSGPRNATIFNAGFANAGKVDVCVDGGAPSGTYTFKHVGFLSDYEIGVSDATPDGADGGNGQTVANVADNTDFTVPVGGCVTVETRTTPDHGFPGSAECPIFLGNWAPNTAYSTVPLRGIRDSNGHAQYVSVAGTSGATEPVWNSSGGTTTDGTVTWQDQGLYPTSGPIGGHWCSGFPDTWSGITLEMSSIPVTAVYTKTDCFLDQGDLPAIPNSGSGTTPPFQCGAGNAHTRAYANHEHGAIVDYYFDSAPAISTAVIAPTATTCADYAKGNAGTLDEIDDGFKGLKINNAAPGVFFYYAKVHKTAGQPVGFIQSLSPNAGGLPPYVVQQTQAYLYTFNGSTCTTVATLGLTDGGTTASGGTALATGDYILGVKFGTDAPNGTVVPAGLNASGSLLATENYEATVNGVQDPTTTASVNTKAK